MQVCPQTMQEHESPMVDASITNLPMAIAVLDMQGTILHISTAWQAFASAFGMPSLARAGIGTHYLAVIESAVQDQIDGAHEVQEGIGAVLAGDVPFFTRWYSHRSLKEMGGPVEPFWFLLYVAPLATNPDQVVVAQLNMTAHKLLEEQTFAANQEMSDFLSHFSHEARTPLASFDGYVQLARRRLQRMRDDAQQGKLTGDALDQRLADLQQTIEQARAPARRLNRLIGDLAEVAQIQSGQLTLQRIPCDLVEIVKQALADQQLSWPARQLQLQLPVQAVPILADPDRIGEVVTNYLTNALKYAPEDRPIETTVSIQTGQARLQVRDHGPGISADEQARIWQWFYRSPNAHAREGVGMSLGVGLYICRNIIAQHGGQTGVNSAHGRGATFWFTVPVLMPG